MIYFKNAICKSPYQAGKDTFCKHVICWHKKNIFSSQFLCCVKMNIKLLVEIISAYEKLELSGLTSYEVSLFTASPHLSHNGLLQNVLLDVSQCYLYHWDMTILYNHHFAKRKRKKMLWSTAKNICPFHSPLRRLDFTVSLLFSDFHVLIVSKFKPNYQKMLKKEKHKVSVILHSNVINVQGICTKITVKYCESQDKISYCSVVLHSVWTNCLSLETCRTLVHILLIWYLLFVYIQEVCIFAHIQYM